MAGKQRKSVEQIAALSRHDDDKKRIQEFLSTWRGKENTKDSGDMKTMCCCAVSTTLNSTVYLFGVGMKAIFESTTLYSENIHNPWVITGHAETLPELAKFICTQWGEMEVRGNRKRINLISPYIVYDATDLEKPPQLIPLEGDDEDFVRARIDDISIWSHPPRDKPLHQVLVEKHGEKGMLKYDQKIGSIKQCAQEWKELHDSINEEVPNEKMSKRMEEQRQKVRDAFNKLYTAYYEQYKLATLQLEQRYPPSSGIKPTTFATLFTVALVFLYSAFFSSNSLYFSFAFSSLLFLSFLYYYFKVYPHPDKEAEQNSRKTYTDATNYDNEVHRPFPTNGMNQRDPKKKVFDQLVGNIFGMDFDDTMVCDIEAAS